jgi:reverse transcriptase-like protein
MGPERRGRADQGQTEANPAGEEPRMRPKPKVKSFEISKRLVFEAWEKVRANNGAPGVDAVGIAEFAERERDNLYRLWNRMSSGSYFPGPVRAVEIPKDHGRGVRVLGVLNTADRVARTAAAMLLEARLEPIFHPDSYGYRPGRSAHDALAVTRKRCWKQDWVLDLDVRAFFDSVPHDLLLKAVAHHTDERWVLLYISRWLKAPMQMPDGTLAVREKGTPQGSLCSAAHNPPCGAPLRVAFQVQSSKYPACSMLPSSRRNRLSRTFAPTIDSRIEWSRLPKQSAISPSMNQLVPVQIWATYRSAVWQPRPGRSPWERSENVGS